MHDGMIHLHNFMRWVVLILAVLAVVKYLIGMLTKKDFSKSDDTVGLIYMIVMDIQLLVGLYLYATSSALQNLMADFGATMKAPIDRFFAVEHLVGMLLAIILVHIGRSRVKKYSESSRKYRIGFIFYLVALLIMLAMIPWPFREGIGKPWFPGM